jgi:hypothetical protein
MVDRDATTASPLEAKKLSGDTCCGGSQVASAVEGVGLCNILRCAANAGLAAAV